MGNLTEIFPGALDQQKIGHDREEKELPQQRQQESMFERQKNVRRDEGNELLGSLSSFIREEVSRLERKSAGFVKINRLQSRILKTPLDAVIEPDEDGYIARTIDLPLYGYGDDPIEAVDALKDEISSLYDDLMEDDKMTPEWLMIKDILKDKIIDK